MSTRHTGYTCFDCGAELIFDAERRGALFETAGADLLVLPNGSSMPKGVEHLIMAREPIRPVVRPNGSSMPKGVEHRVPVPDLTNHAHPNGSSMPKGVEHRINPVWSCADIAELIFDAERRGAPEIPARLFVDVGPNGSLMPKGVEHPRGRKRPKWIKIT